MNDSKLIRNRKSPSTVGDRSSIANVTTRTKCHEGSAVVRPFRVVHRKTNRFQIEHLSSYNLSYATRLKTALSNCAWISALRSEL
ncbi:hypothetical protein AB6A40_002156 [Gnathostoma spinigerum]|uniref:Uncharacterized protein n=1 Tax=Gnathostoma spinigerum TaxID=75299 RepID=A0ABD6E830_9BILA